MSPLANSYLRPEQLHSRESFYPLCAYVCDHCFLVQLEECESPNTIFGDYAYFSSYAESWLRHAREYVDLVVERFGFDKSSQVVEVGSNDGYLLQYFLARGIPVLGIDPAANVAEVARQKNIPTRVGFFGQETASELVKAGVRADLLIGNNVFAHVPDVNDFTRGLKILLKPTGTITMEFPHLLCLIAESQFDTIYHEHFSYYSFLTVEKIFAAHGLMIFDVDELTTHGGSLRIYACHVNDSKGRLSEKAVSLKNRELDAGLATLDAYLHFEEGVKKSKQMLLEFLIGVKREGKKVVGYGAPAKGNTLLNYCGVRGDFLDYTVDVSPHKQGLFLPGTHIPIFAPQKLRETRPDYVLVLPWNLRDEIAQQHAYIREWGGQFVVPIPEPKVY
jgi:SAM-dependent methyltransferase